MAEKDIAEKHLEDYPEVFSDVLNVLLFHGERLVKPEEISPLLPRSMYKVDDALHEMERDVLKQWKRQTIRIAEFGMENESAAEKYLPCRVLAYDGASYRTQLLHRREAADRNRKRAPAEPASPVPDVCPVTTLVLYFGLERWTQSLSLKDDLVIPEELDPYVQDYRINLFSIAWLSDETVNLFQSDFRLVAEFFVQLRKKKNHEIDQISLSRYDIVHVEEVLGLFRAMTGNRGYEKAYEMLQGSRRDTIVRDVLKEVFKDELDEAKEEARAEGRAEGKAEGRAEGKAEGRVEGKAEGRAEGEASGENKRAVKAFRNAIAKGLSRQDAIEISEISAEALAALEQEA